MNVPQQSRRRRRPLNVEVQAILNALARRWNDDLGYFFFFLDNLVAETHMDEDRVAYLLEHLERQAVIYLCDDIELDGVSIMWGGWGTDPVR